MSGWANPKWGLNTLVHSFTAGVGGGLGHAAATGIVHSVSGAIHHAQEKKEEKKKEHAQHAASAPQLAATSAPPQQQQQQQQPVAPPPAIAPSPTVHAVAPSPSVHAVAPSPSAPPLAPNVYGALPDAYFTAPSVPSSAPPARPPPPLHHFATMLKSFEAHTPAELSVQVGTKVEVLHPDPSGWTEVLMQGKRGWVPSAFLSPVFDE